MKKLIAQKTTDFRAKLAGLSGKPLLFCIFLSAVMITICSTCSFLFATNSWVDANCLFTVGRSMFHGQVLYRDIIDHKGLYIYAINILGYLLSHRSFFGMYLVEILFFSVFLYVSYRSLRIYISRHTALFLMPLLAATVAACNSFDRGCSAEEFVLPMAAACIYFMLRYLDSGCDEAQMDRKTLFINGILAGVVLWIKYTMLGLWFGFMAMVFFLMLSKKQVKRAFVSCLIFLGGMAAASLPALLYFGVNGALSDCWNVYFYDNIFLYTTEKSSLSDLFSTMRVYYLRQSKGNPFVTLSVWGGMFWSVLFMIRKESGKAFLLRRLALPVMYLFLLLGIYWGGKNFWYYFLITAPFGVSGFIALGLVWERTGWQNFRMDRTRTAFLAGLTLLSAVWAWFDCNNASLHLEKWEDTEQYQFAQVMSQSEHPTLQVYDFFDPGFYNALDIVPACPYFTLFNQPKLLDAARVAQYDIILHRQVEYVVCWNIVPSFVQERYVPVSYHRDSGHILLRRNDAQRYATTFAGQENGRGIATADCINWHCIRNGQDLILEGSLPAPVLSGSLRVMMPISESAQIPEFQVAGPDGNFTPAQISTSVDIDGMRFVLLTFPDTQLTRIRIIPDQTDGSWQTRIDIMTSEPWDTPLYESPIAKPLGHENSAASYLTMDSNIDTGWHTETAQTKGQVFDLILDQPYAGICGVKLTPDPRNEKYVRALQIHSTPDNENWSLLDSWSENQTDFFFDPETTCMLRLITGDIPEGTAEEWAINEVYLWKLLPTEEAGQLPR